MKLVVGLGNPGAKYANTRHNVGWMMIEAFAAKRGVALDKTGFHGIYGEIRGATAEDRIILLKPLTYMNLSGQAVGAAAHFFKITPENLLVIYDDLDLPPGKLRMREKGSAGGHNGMKSIIEHLGTQEFARLRLGIGRPEPGWEVVDWVLTRFAADDAASIAAALPRAVDAITCWLDDGALKAMAQVNARTTPE